MLPDQLYRIRDAANLLALRPATLYRLIASNAIAAVRPTSRAVRISAQELIRIQRAGLRPRGAAASQHADAAARDVAPAARGRR